MNLARFVTAILLSVFSLSIYSLAFAANVTPTSAPEPASSENWTATQQAPFTMDAMAAGGICFFGGPNPYGRCPAHTVNTKTGKIQVMLYDKVPGNGIIGSVSNVMIAMYNSPPTSTTQYLASIGSDLGLIKPVYAAVGGSGEGIIRPIQSLWYFTRNLAYLLMILIFIVIGFMIMFRQKINPQTVITAQAAIPGLIISLVLITFSYFIASVLIDTSYVGIQLIAQIFISNGKNVFNVANLADNSNIFQLYATGAGTAFYVGDIASGLFNTLGSTTASMVSGAAQPADVGQAIASIISGVIAVVVGATATVAGTALLTALLPLILLIAFFIQFMRLLFKLVNAYISLLIYTIIGPFFILFSTIPGKSGTLTSWWKTILGNALVFPAVFATFLFAGYILGSTDQTVWGSARPPLFGSIDTGILRLVLAYALMLGLPAVPDMVKNALGIKEPQGIPGQALGGLMAGIGIGQRAFRAGTQEISHAREDYLKKTAAPTYTNPVIKRVVQNPVAGGVFDALRGGRGGGH